MYEISLVAASKARLQSLAQTGSKRAIHLLKLIEQPEKTLSTIQVGITLISIVSGAFGGVAIASDFAIYLAKFDAIKPYSHEIAAVAVIGAITYLSLVIGELVPKSLALNSPEKVALTLTPFVIFLTKMAYPFVWLLSISTRILNKLIGINPNEQRAITEEELRFMLNQSSQQGLIDQKETKMIRDVFRFSDKKACDIMTHRMDVTFIREGVSKDELIKTITENHYSKYVVFEDNSEEVMGVLAVKDIAPFLGNNDTLNLKGFISKPVFLPENILASKVLETFKQKRSNFGVVISEYGAMEGIVTLHDITEAILGDIPEEFEEHIPSITQRQDGSLLVDASMNLGDFMDEMGILAYDDLKDEGFSTLSGMAMYFLRKVPTEGEVFKYKNLTFEILDMDNSRVDKLLVEVNKS